MSADQASSDSNGLADTGVDVVTGAFSYSGGAIARTLIESGREVRTVTGHPDRAPQDSPITAHRLAFDQPDLLVEAMSGATTLYNTYWVRFAHREHRSRARRGQLADLVCAPPSEPASNASYT